MNILALDLGTKTGWALHARSGALSSGTVNCAPKGDENAGHRWLKFRHHLSDMARAVGVLHVVYAEDVLHHPPGQVFAAHAYGGFRAHLETWCAINNVRLVWLNVSTIKRTWTGKGNSNKEAMLAEARRRGFKPVDDNNADALAIMHCALVAEGLAAKAPQGVLKVATAPIAGMWIDKGDGVLQPAAVRKEAA